MSGGVYDTLADVYDWLVPEALLEPEGSVAAFDMRYRPFTHEELQADLIATGFEPAASTFSLEAERYLVTSRANSSNASR